MDYESQHRTEEVNDQGPWGGHRAVHWMRTDKDSFKIKELIEYAASQGWTFVDSTFHSAAQVEEWTITDKPIFPLTWTGFEPEMSQNDMKYEDFPRWIDSDIRALHFRTGWISVQPGIGDSYDVNGFVLLNKDFTQMSVYHMWGE